MDIREEAKAWVRRERRNGLVDVKFAGPPSRPGATVDDVLADFMVGVRAVAEGRAVDMTGEAF
jgi:hypothetical protein